MFALRPLLFIPSSRSCAWHAQCGEAGEHQRARARESYSSVCQEVYVLANTMHPAPSPTILHTSSHLLYRLLDHELLDAQVKVLGVVLVVQRLQLLPHLTLGVTHLRTGGERGGGTDYAPTGRLLPKRTGEMQDVPNPLRFPPRLRPSPLPQRTRAHAHLLPVSNPPLTLGPPCLLSLPPPRPVTYRHVLRVVH